MDYRIFLYARLICSFISFFIHRYNYRYYCKSHFAIEKSQTLYIRWSIFQTIIIRRLMHIELVQVWVFLSFSTWSKILSNIHVCKKIKVNKDFQSWVTSAEAYNYGSIWRESKKNDNCNTCTQIPECNRWTIIHIKLRKSVILMKDIKNM